MGRHTASFLIVLLCPSCLALLPTNTQPSRSRPALFTKRLHHDKQVFTRADALHTTKETYRSYSPNAIISSIKVGYTQRLAADPSFLSKSILEIILAAATQYAAEVGRRGQHRILPEIDFVAAGILTAICGKYYSMWRVAKTVACEEDYSNNMDFDANNDSKAAAATASSSWRDAIPTNAFQPTLLDGRTKPSISGRFNALLLPMPELFRAGVIASTIGYGLTSALIRLRSVLLPEYVAPTAPVPVLWAAIYTGVFMAIVSNIRYQVLQGLIEPFIEGGFKKMENTLTESNKSTTNRRGIISWSKAKGLVIALVRWANGLLGSWIAIGGMKACGLQKMR